MTSIATTDLPDVKRPKGQRACKRKAHELRAACELHRRIKVFAEAEQKAAEFKALPGQKRLFDEAELAQKRAWLSQFAGDNQKALVAALDALQASGPWRDVGKAPPPAVLNELLLDYPNFGDVTRLIQQRLLLNRLAKERPISLPPILLNGPPGIGKTAYCQRLAGLLGIRYESIDLSASTANFTLAGLDSGYSNSKPGRIWQSLQHGSLSILWLIDELDKVARHSRDGGANHLLGLLEPVSSCRFTDNCVELPINAAHICYLATSNDKSAIDKPLISRFEVFDVKSPTSEQLKSVVRSIYHGIREVEAWGKKFDENVHPAVVEELAQLSPREIRRCLFGAFACAASHSRTTLIALDVQKAQVSKKETQRRIGFI